MYSHSCSLTPPHSAWYGSSVFTIPCCNSLRPHVFSEESSSRGLLSLVRRGREEHRYGCLTGNGDNGSTTQGEYEAIISTSLEFQPSSIGNRASADKKASTDHECEMNNHDNINDTDSRLEVTCAMDIPTTLPHEGLQADNLSSFTASYEDKDVVVHSRAGTQLPSSQPFHARRHKGNADACESPDYDAILQQETHIPQTQIDDNKERLISLYVERMDDPKNSSELEGGLSRHNMSFAQFKVELKSILQHGDLHHQRICLMHATAIKNGFEQKTLISNILMSMYRKLGLIKYVAIIFNKMHYPSVVSWNTMISALAEQELPHQAFQLYLEMEGNGFEPTQITLIIALSICIDLAEGKAIHAYVQDHVVEPPIKLLNALINMYGKCGDLKAARAVFDNMQERDVVSWNSVLYAYSMHVDWQKSESKEPIGLFTRMQLEGFEPDIATLLAVLASCSSAGLLLDGISVHQYAIYRGFESNTVVGNALINMYGKCKTLDYSFLTFARLPKKSEVSWNALITACAGHNQVSKAYQVFQDMLGEGIIPNAITFLGLINACDHPDALALGKTIQERITLTKFRSLCHINNALINMYAKCGACDDARSVFDNMSTRNLISWTTLIAKYCEDGKGEEAIKIFRQMQHAKVQLDGVSFLTLLTACCQLGLLEEGVFFFDSLVNEYRITPTLKHFTCMVHIFGHAGQLQKAEDTILQMPHTPDYRIWWILLCACRKHNDTEGENRIAKHLQCSFPHDVGRYARHPNVDGADSFLNEVGNVGKATA